MQKCYAFDLSERLYEGNGEGGTAACSRNPNDECRNPKFVLARNAPLPVEPAFVPRSRDYDAANGQVLESKIENQKSKMEWR